MICIQIASMKCFAFLLALCCSAMVGTWAYVMSDRTEHTYRPPLMETSSSSHLTTCSAVILIGLVASVLFRKGWWISCT